MLVGSMLEYFSENPGFVLGQATKEGRNINVFSKIRITLLKTAFRQGLVSNRQIFCVTRRSLQFIADTV
jgi:hypothetical protein